MRASIKVTSIAVAVLLLGCPAVAAAQDDSAIDEYIESVPDAAGNAHSGGGSGNGNPLPDEQRDQLEAQGPSGSRAADLAEQTAPTLVSENAAGEPGSASEQGGVEATADAGPSVGAPAGTVSASGEPGGVGTGLWILIGLTTIGALTVAGVRWARSRGTAS